VSVSVVLNGEPRDLVPGTTVVTLVAELERGPRGLAVAVNEEVVPRHEWPTTALRAGDRVEILHAAQGG